MRRQFVERQRGATLLDYTLMVMLITLVASFPLAMTGLEIKNQFIKLDIELERSSAAGQAGAD
jgi:Flp pilus assembly pilin Flp